MLEMDRRDLLARLACPDCLGPTVYKENLAHLARVDHLGSTVDKENLARLELEGSLDRRDEQVQWGQQVLKDNRVRLEPEVMLARLELKVMRDRLDQQGLPAQPGEWGRQELQALQELTDIQGHLDHKEPRDLSDQAGVREQTEYQGEIFPPVRKACKEYVGHAVCKWCKSCKAWKIYRAYLETG